MKTFVHQGITFEYKDTGSGVPFVFLHGLGGGIHQVEGTYVPVEGVRFIAMNQQGHGGSGSDPTTLSFDRMGDDTIALLDHLGIEAAVFAGISMGAAIALNLATRYPGRVKSLILIRNAWIDCPFSDDRILAYGDMGRCLHEGGLEAFQKTAGWEIVKEPSAYTRNAFTLPFSEAFNVKNWEKFLILPPQKAFEDRAQLKKLSMPVHIIACRGDYCHPYGYGVWLHRELPGSSFTEIPNKDIDGAAHKKMINEVLREVLLEKAIKIL